MNHDRQLGRARQFHLPQEDLLLQFARRVIVEIVQPDFAPGNDLGPFRQLFEFLKVGVGGQLGFMRMDADGGVDKFVLLGQSNAAVQRAGPGSAANGDDLFNAAVPRPRDHLLAVGVELLHLEMGVGVYEHRIGPRSLDVSLGLGLSMQSELGPSQAVEL